MQRGVRLVAQVIHRGLRWGGIAVVGLALGMGMRIVIPRVITMGKGKPEATANRGLAEGREIAFWKSSMIPNFVSPKPGLDPMGMELIPVYADQLGQEKFITLDHQTVRNMGLRTVAVWRGTADRVLRTVGRVDYAEPLLGDVTLKIGGWVEDLSVTYVGQRVEKGKPLFTFYSPELVTAEEEYLIGRESAQTPSSGSKPSLFASGNVFSAYDKLRYWDVPLSEIDKIKKTKRAIKAVTFVSPFDGWVIEKHAFEGMYMQPGKRFYRIADLTTMWVYVTLYEYQLPLVRTGQETRLTLPYRPGKVFRGKVIYIYPYVNPKTRQILVRLEFPNPQLLLKPEMYADVEIAIPTERKKTTVPLDAVIYNGGHKTIGGRLQRVGHSYVRVAPGKFEPREVVLGDEIEGGRLEVLSGLQPGEQVVVSGQFQLDSERRVKKANLKMLAKAHKDDRNSP